MNKKANITMYITFLIFAIIIIIITAVVAPFGVKLNTEAYAMGEQIYASANESIENINDPVIRTQIQTIINNSLDTTMDNIEINNAMFKYSWLIMILLVGLTLFLITRSLVEINSRFGGGVV